MDQFYRKPATAERHRTAPLVGPYLDDVVGYLAKAGYSQQTVRQYICACDEFGHFLARRHITLHDLTETHVETFLNKIASKRTWHGVRVEPADAINLRRRPVTLLLARLRRAGVVTVEAETPNVQPSHHAVLDGYLSFLERHRGIGEATIRQHRLHVGRFLRQIDNGPEAMHRLTARDLDQFIVECGRWMSRRSISRPTAALRGFLRFLHMSGQTDRDLSPQVAIPRVYALETVPRALVWSDVQKLLASPDRSNAAGRRDYAILMLLAVYGLRAGEVAALALQDIDWRRSQLRINRSKGGAPSWYPLHSEVGESIIEYLRRGRPATSFQQIFVTHSAPVRPFPRSSPISNVVMRHLRRAGIDSPHWGSHTIRHSRAVHLLQQGFSLNAIGELLGHRHQQSSFIYAKAALDDLRSVGLEVTEVLP
ncbi:MAG: tyrosine-type recombinase/integrase [Thermoplasmata archaeon]